MSDLLIPFGIHKVTGAIVEPEDAAKGRACDCLCPGCKAPLLCRHPKEMRDHFAHDSRHEHARPVKHCPFSSAVAVAMMIREMVPAYVGKLLATPALEVSERCPRCRHYESIKVTQSAHNRVDEAEANVSLYGHRVDVKLMISGHPLLVDLVYRGKLPMRLDEAALQGDRVAVLELDCDHFSLKAIKRNRELRFSQAILAYFLNHRFKSWRFHPRTELLRAQVKQAHQRQCEREYVRLPRRPVNNSSSQTPQPMRSEKMHHRDWDDTSPKDPAVQPRVERPAPAHNRETEQLKVVTTFKCNKPVPKKTIVEKPMQSVTSPDIEQALIKAQKYRGDSTVTKRFECVLCNLSWEHHGNSAWKCPQCHSHLYAREIR